MAPNASPPTPRIWEKHRAVLRSATTCSGLLDLLHGPVRRRPKSTCARRSTSSLPWSDDVFRVASGCRTSSGSWYHDLAEVLTAMGRLEEAEEARRQSLAAWESAGTAVARHIPARQRTRALPLGRTAPPARVAPKRPGSSSTRPKRSWKTSRAAGPRNRLPLAADLPVGQLPGCGAARSRAGGRPGPARPAAVGRALLALSRAGPVPQRAVASRGRLDPAGDGPAPGRRRLRLVAAGHEPTGSSVRKTRHSRGTRRHKRQSRPANRCSTNTSA